ncbi:MAG: adenylate/guanylate cyclase domain-containing protein [Actinomycetota bacterium]
MTDTQYARNGRVHIAYQVFGDGPLDLVFLPGTLLQMDAYDEHPLMSRFVRRLASFSRLIVLDRRGIGQSDAVGTSEVPDEFESAEDLLAVIDAAGADKPSILAGFDSATVAIVLAATQPDRVRSLVLVNAFATFLRADDRPWGVDPGRRDEFERLVEGEQGPEFDLLGLVAPSVSGDSRFRDWWDRAGRRAAGPATALALTDFMFRVDVREHLARVAAPTLVVHKKTNHFVNIEEGRNFAAHIPQAQLLELEGEDHLIWVEADGILDASEEFLTGTRGAPVDRVLSTVLFTDIVDSTKLATELGDRRWHELLDTHDRTSARSIERNGGRLVKQTGDGLLATFAGPGPAIRCAIALREELASEGVRIRAGIHTGEVEVRGDDVGGIAVHIAARVMGEAGPDEIIVSSVVPPLVVGSAIEFTDRGRRELKGVPGEWRILSVDS